MLFEIKHQLTGKILFSITTTSLSLAIKAAASSSADLCYANLSSADLCCAKLRSANLSCAKLRSANLRSANLRYADLSSADLSSADLSYADLRQADLSYANLRCANLSHADLRYADLCYANLRYADLSYADLRHAQNSKLSIAMTRILPEGDIIGWKKTGNSLVKLLIPKEAKRSHAFGRKCRAEFVKVLDIEGQTKVVTSKYGPKTIYKVGAIVKPDHWDNDFTQECSHGIHFFITREEAEAYNSI